MFYCTPCGDARGWPTWMPLISRGPCEVCKEVRSCHDVRSDLLPSPKPTANQEKVS